jgi:hypothetical protein
VVAAGEGERLLSELGVGVGGSWVVARPEMRGEVEKMVMLVVGCGGGRGGEDAEVQAVVGMGVIPPLLSWVRSLCRWEEEEQREGEVAAFSCEGERERSN